MQGDPQLELEAKNEDNIIERNASTKVEENDDEETETEIQDKLKEPPAVSARSTTCSSENAIIKPFKKSYSVEATSTTGMWYLHKLFLHFCCVAFEIYLC